MSPRGYALHLTRSLHRFPHIASPRSRRPIALPAVSDMPDGEMMKTLQLTIQL